MAGNFEGRLGKDDDTAKMREKALTTVKTFKIIKNAIWETSIIWDNVEKKDIPK